MEYRMVPIKRLVTRLDLEAYNHRAPMRPLQWQPEQVTIPLQQHIGAPSQAIVTPGTQVSLGQCIAVAQPQALGVNIHASIAGTVSQVSQQDITIIRE